MKLLITKIESMDERLRAMQATLDGMQAAMSYADPSCILDGDKKLPIDNPDEMLLLEVSIKRDPQRRKALVSKQ